MACLPPTIPQNALLAPLVYLNLHVALIAWGFLLSAAHFIDAPVPLPLQGLVISATLTVYALDRSGHYSPEDLLNHPDRTHWLRSHPRTVHALILLSLAGLLLCLALSPPHTRWVAAAYALLAALYSRPLLPGNRRLRDFPHLKITAVVLGWSALPLLHPDIAAAQTIPLWILYRALWILANVLWSEWRDLPGDSVATAHPTLSRLTLPLLLRTSRITLLTSILLGASLHTRADLAGPLLFLLLQESLGRHSPKSFTRFLDAPLLLPALLALLYS